MENVCNASLLSLGRVLASRNPPSAFTNMSRSAEWNILTAVSATVAILRITPWLLACPNHSCDRGPLSVEFFIPRNILAKNGGASLQLITPKNGRREEASLQRCHLQVSSQAAS